MKLLHGECDSVHLLHELRADETAERIAAGAGDEDAAVAGSNARFGFHAMKEFKEFLRLTRLMPLVVAPENAPAPCFDDQRLHCGRPHVQSHAKADAGFGPLLLGWQF